MAPAETSSGFLRIAHRDLRTAMAMADPSLFEESTWGFHLQQAIEKTLKAWLLVLTPEQPPFSHNLRLLFQMLRDQGAAVEPFLGLSRFTLFAVVWRYDEEPELEHLDRAAWNQLCADLHAHVAALIP
ncbi:MULTISPECIES: HEPN domain-containing protein [unclassified Synechococcus]|uniref:HEPN domain-containing protein n=1 Tax=unclassified Synechococcus TaxID=2626047 RepID=UPI000560DACF|nr:MULTISPECIES: HEPN domain-containing protein [unclassified Synechococcus]WFN60361.1 HEPN domain-containing protein [Synechococcus sp. CCFWC 502]